MHAACPAGQSSKLTSSAWAFIWASTASCTGGKRKVAWPVVCRPAYPGGLGVIDLCFFGLALRLRWEWLSRSEPQRCWVSLPSRPERCVAAMSATSMTVTVGDGASTTLWTDNWSSVGPLHLFAPALFAAISCSGLKRLLCDTLQNNQWARDITRATMMQVLCDYL